MKVELKEHECIVTREPGDPTFRAGGYAGGWAAESRLLHWVKLALNRNLPSPQGTPCLKVDSPKDIRDDGWIKKRMWKDGHMTGEHRQYVRTRKAPFVMISDEMYAVRSSAEEFNTKGSVTLNVTRE